MQVTIAKTALLWALILTSTAASGQVRPSPGQPQPVGPPGEPGDAEPAEFPGQPATPRPPHVFSYRGGPPGNPRADYAPPVLVQFSAADPAALQNMEEDLAVMGRLIDRKVESEFGEEAPSTMGVRLIYTAGGRSLRALYLEGFGALFMLRVNFPLIGPPPRGEKESAKAADSEWERAKRDVLADSEPANGGPAFEPGKVETLKSTLVETLKDASHIRNLKPEESVTISVFGPSGPGRGPVRVGRKSVRKPLPGAGGPAAEPLLGDVTVSPKGPMGWYSADRPQKGSVLTLRAKKADIDAFAEGKLSLDAFTQKVVSNTYIGSGYGPNTMHTVLQSDGDVLVK